MNKLKKTLVPLEIKWNCPWRRDVLKLDKVTYEEQIQIQI